MCFAGHYQPLSVFWLSAVTHTQYSNLAIFSVLSIIEVCRWLSNHQSMWCFRTWFGTCFSYTFLCQDSLIYSTIQLILFGYSIVFRWYTYLLCTACSINNQIITNMWSNKKKYSTQFNSQPWIYVLLNSSKSNLSALG